MQRTFAWHRDAVELPREPDGKVGDVNRLLHLADAFRPDLPDLKRLERAERVEVPAELFTDCADNLTALRCRRFTPSPK